MSGLSYINPKDGRQDFRILFQGCESAFIDFWSLWKAKVTSVETR